MKSRALLLSLAIAAFSVAGWTSVPAASASTGAAAAYQRSYQLEAARDYRGALAAIEKIPADHQSSYTFHLRKGWLRYLAGDHAAAVGSYQRAVSIAPAAIEPLLGMMLPQMAQRRWQDAVATGRRVLGKDRRSYLARTRVAWALYNLGRFEKSRAMYEKVLADYPSKVNMRAGLGWCLLKLGRSEEAAAAFRAVLGVAPRHGTARSGLEMLGLVP